MSTENLEAATATATATPAAGAAETITDQAARHTLAANPMVGVRGRDILDATTMVLGQIARHPAAAARHSLALLGEFGRIATGRSEAPDTKDKRFADPAWHDNAAYRMLAKSYLAWGDALNRFVDEIELDKRDAERARFVVALLVDAMAPTNALAGNPAALKKAIQTGGASALQGLRNFLADLARNRGLPAQVDTSKFTVGRNLATTEGAVVFRSPVMELIQYRPRAAQVHRRPLLIAPPQINKYYVFDLSPDKSIVKMALEGGLQTFAVSWKNPTAADRDFGLDTYVEALEQAVDAVREITGAEDVNLWGACSGGITTSAFLANLAARGERKVHSATIAVCVLDMAVAQSTTAGAFVTPETVVAAKTASQLAGVLEGQELSRMFAWMRPNDLIWNYWVNNYLLGNPPPAFDILYWNSDSTRLPARLHADFLDLIETNPFVQPGRLEVRGETLDMRRVDLDTYVVAGLTDHITPWQGCYNTARLFGVRSGVRSGVPSGEPSGERSVFVLSNSGHIQSLLNPPGNPKAFFWANEARAADAQAWLESASKQQGSWWPHWLEWIKARSGEVIDPPAALGSAAHAPLCEAPGQYVMEK